MRQTDNLDRIPTRLERFQGAVASALIFLFLGAVVGFGAYWLFRQPGQASLGVVILLCGLAVLAVWAACMFMKIVRGTPEKPSLKGQLAVGVFATIFGGAYLGALLVIAYRTSTEVPQSAIPAVMTLVSGIAWSRHAWKRIRANGA